MFEWLIGATIRVSSNGVQAFRGLSVSAAAANTEIKRATGSITAQDAAWARYEQRRARLNSRYTMLGIGVADGVAALGGAMIEHGVAGAAKLEMAMTTVGLATGSTAKQLESLRQMVLSVSGVTAQSSDVIAQEMATAARAGMSSYARLSATFPSIAKFADVLYLSGKASGQNISPVEAVNVGTQFAHYFQAYKPSELLGSQKNPGMLDWLVRLMMVQPESINRLLAQGKYFIPFGKALGMSTPQIMELMATMGQTGFLRGRGGTSIENTLMGAINATTLTGYGAKKRRGALEQLGILDDRGRNTVIKQGKLDWGALMNRLATAADKLSSVDYARDLKSAFNMQATQFLSVLNTPAVRAQMKFIEDAMKRMGTVESFFSRFINNLLPQMMRAATNFTNLLINVFSPTLPFLTREFKALADELGRLGDWFAAHPKAAMGTAIGAFAAVAGGAIYAATMLWRLNASILALGDTAKIKGIAGAAGAVEGEGAAVAEGAAAGGIFGRFAAIGGVLARFAAPFMVVGRLFVWLGERFIPIAGWVLAAVTAIEAFNWAMKHFPDIVGAIVKWWREDRYHVAYEVGYVFGVIGRMIQEGISGLITASGAAVSAFMSNLGDLLTPGGRAQLIAQMAKAAEKAIKGSKDQGGIIKGLTTGVWAGANGHPNAFINAGGARSPITINGGVHMNLPPGSSKQHADAVLQELARRMRIAPQHTIQSQPRGMLTHPNFSPALHPSYAGGGAH